MEIDRYYKMKVFVTGVNGQLGYDVLKELHKRGHIGIGSGKSSHYNGETTESFTENVSYIQLDITDKACVRKTISEIKPDAVIHCPHHAHPKSAQ